MKNNGRNWILYRVVAVAVFLLGVGYLMPVDAQDRCPFRYEEIEIGDSMEGRINSNTPFVDYCFEGEAGDVVVIDMQRDSGSLDPFLQLSDASGDEVLATNDDRGLTTTDAQITFEIPETGAYVIRATRFNVEAGSTQGIFELTLTSSDSEDTGGSSTGERPDDCPILYGSIDFGEIRRGTINDDDYAAFYCFSGRRGDEIVFEMEATEGSLDTYIIITDLKFDEVFEENDDIRLGNSDSRLLFVLPETGGYLITVTRYNLEDGTTEGEYELTMMRNDGTFEEEFLGAPALPYECNRPLVSRLNQSQWIEEDGRYGFKLNFGCEGYVAVTIFDEIFAIPYEISRDEVSLTLGDIRYEIDLSPNQTLNLNTEDADPFVFKGEGQGECESRPMSELIDGVWYLEENTNFLRLDFMCNGVVIVTLDGITSAHKFVYDTAEDTLTIDFPEDDLVWTDVFILPGNALSAEDDEGGIILTNVLLDIEGTMDSDI